MMNSTLKRISTVLFWSVIAAAFVGPGTVTTASKAGASFGLSLSWALLFSIIATVVLQEAAARITIASGKNLGHILKEKYGEKSIILSWIIFLAIAFGCAAYQTGNILGAISGLKLFSAFSAKLWILIIAVVCTALLWTGKFKLIAQVLGLVVAVMGMIFIYVALSSKISWTDAGASLANISIPEGSALLIIGLIGTTIVPYNLFLGAGISKGQSIKDMRFGISVAVIIGGLISYAIMLVGTQVVGEFSFEALGNALSSKTGEWMLVFFGFGLFAAGLSSAITAPFAAAVTAQSMFETDSAAWSAKSKNFRIVWVIVLSIGLFFGLTEIKPIPAIIMAQAVNGILLPIVAIWVLIFVNDKSIVGKNFTNGLVVNLLSLVIVFICIFLGLYNITIALSKVAGFTMPTDSLRYLLLPSAVLIIPLIYTISRLQKV